MSYRPKPNRNMINDPVDNVRAIGVHCLHVVHNKLHIGAKPQAAASIGEDVSEVLQMTKLDNSLKLIDQFTNYRLNHLAHSKATVKESRTGLRMMATDAAELFPKVEFLKLSTKQLEMLLDSYSVSAGTRANRITYLHGFFRWAKRMEMVKVNPCDEIERPKLPGANPRPFTLSEAERIFGLCRCPRMFAWMALAYYQGMRVHEIADMKYDWLDLERRTLTIYGKGNKLRVLPLSADALFALNQYGLDYRMPDRHVFLTRNGTPYRPATISMGMARYLKGCGITKTAHKLRHSFGTNLYEATGDLEIARAGLGHSSLDTTKRYVPSAGTHKLERAFAAMPTRIGRQRHLDVPA